MRRSRARCRVGSICPRSTCPAAQARERKTLCGMRDALVGARTKVVNTRARLAARRGPPPARRRRRHISRPGPGALRRGRAVPQLRGAAAADGGGPARSEIAEADRELAAAAKADPIARRLMTVPGVGPSTVVRFVAALDEISRFPGAHAVESYLGLVPGEDSSADRKRRTSITKAGPTALRWCLVQAAWAARRARRKDPMHRWADEVEKRRGRRVAVLALARKLAGILFAIWRDGTVYEPRRSGAV